MIIKFDLIISKTLNSNEAVIPWNLKQRGLTVYVLVTVKSVHLFSVIITSLFRLQKEETIIFVLMISISCVHTVTVCFNNGVSLLIIKQFNLKRLYFKMLEWFFLGLELPIDGIS